MAIFSFAVTSRSNSSSSLRLDPSFSLLDFLLLTDSSGVRVTSLSPSPSVVIVVFVVIDSAETGVADSRNFFGSGVK